MKKISFPYEVKPSSIFKKIKRPVAEVSFLSPRRKIWISFIMIVDTGADYTIFPFSAAPDLGIDIEKECAQHLTRGVGGTEKVYLFRKKVLMKIGDLKIKTLIGFLERDDIPPLLGRYKSLDLADVRFAHFITSFTELKK